MAMWAVKPDYIYASWQRGDMGSRVFVGRALSASETATLCLKKGFEVPAMVSADCELSASEATHRQPRVTGTSEQGEGASKSRAEILQSLSACVRQAYLAYLLGETINGRHLEDQEAYDYIKENGFPENGDLGELTDYELPDFDTWARYVRKARKALGEQKYSRRANRPKGRSIATSDEVEPLARDE